MNNIYKNFGIRPIITFKELRKFNVGLLQKAYLNNLKSTDPRAPAYNDAIAITIAQAAMLFKEIDIDNLHDSEIALACLFKEQNGLAILHKDLVTYAGLYNYLLTNSPFFKTIALMTDVEFKNYLIDEFTSLDDIVYIVLLITFNQHIDRIIEQMKEALYYNEIKQILIMSKIETNVNIKIPAIMYPTDTRQTL
jgi:hypothetical protein